MEGWTGDGAERLARDGPEIPGLARSGSRRPTPNREAPGADGLGGFMI